MSILANITKHIGTLGLLCGLAPFMVHAQHAPGAAVESILQGVNEERVASDVLVVGSAHLQAYHDQLTPAHLHSTREQLERFAPTAIAVESLTPDEIALLTEYAGHDSGADMVIGRFASVTIEWGQAMQQALDVNRVVAAQRVESLLEQALDAPEQRLEIIGYMLAAYEYDSAVLQWSYLSEEQREASGLPEGAQGAMNRYLESANEIITLALPLAQDLGIQRLIPIDSQFEALRTVSFPQEDLEAVFGHSKLTEMRSSESSLRVREAPQQALDDGDLLALYQYQNSYAGQVDYTVEWNAWLRMEHESNLDRFRYAMWELRNHRMAEHILNAAAEPEQTRVMVIVGAAHKSYLDRALYPHLSVNLRQFAEFE